MAWQKQTDAASLLGVSLRTITRRVRLGQLDTKRVGRSVMVDIPDHIENTMTNMIEVGDQLAKIASAAAIERHNHDQATIDIRRSSEEVVRHAKRETRNAKIGGLVAFLGMVTFGGICLWVIIDADNATERHGGQLSHVTAISDMRVASLQTSLSDAARRLSATSQAIETQQNLTAKRTAERNIERERRLELEATIADLRNQLEADSFGGVMRRLFTPPAPQPEQIAGK